MVARNSRFPSSKAYSRSDARLEAQRQVQEDLLPLAQQDRLGARPGFDVLVARARGAGASSGGSAKADASTPAAAASRPAGDARLSTRIASLLRRLWAWWSRSA